MGTLIALTFLLTLEDPHRFRQSRDVGCYLGLLPGRRNSGQSQPQYAIDLFQEALRLREKNGVQDSPRVHYHLGLAHARTGQATLARQQSQMILKINPSAPDAAEAKRQLALLQSSAQP